MDAEAKAHSQEWLCHRYLPLGELEMGLDTLIKPGSLINR
jgi:hypothetical protein